MPNIFISYSREDVATARRFAEAFQAAGLEVWWDASLRSGETFDEVIEAALRAAKAVVVLWSPRSVASRWVRAEATMADRNKALAPALIEPCERPIIFELTHTADLSHWRGDATDPAWRGFLADVRRLIDQHTDAPLPVAAQPLPAVQKVTRPHIIVTPFINMSGDAEQEFFSDGVTEDIITDLGRLSALNVVSRNTAFTYKGKTVAPAELTQRFGVTHILEGSVRKSGDRVRITAQLLDAGSDTQIWAERFDRTLEDIFAIQDEISQAIVAALKLKLGQGERQALEQRETDNAEAYELYLLARQFSRQGSERSQPLTVRLCNKAVELDPTFARAWALMAVTMCELKMRNAPCACEYTGLAAAQRAIEINPELAVCHAALAEVYVRGDALDITAGLKSAETALKLDPNCYEAHLILGYCHVGHRHYEDAVSAFETAIALDHRAYRPAGMVIQAYQALGQMDKARAAARRTVAQCEAILGIEPDHGAALGFLVSGLAYLGENERAKALAQRAMLFDPDNLRLQFNLVCAMVNLGEFDTAFDLLEPVVTHVSPGFLRWFNHDNDLDPIRDLPRYAKISAIIDERLKAAGA